MAIIETKQLTKHYILGKKKIVVGLEKVDLEVEQGEIFGILGPNGSGKTTCLKLLLGILFPTSGEARIMGKFPDDIEMKQHVGFLPENPYYYDYLTGPELLQFYASLFSLDAGTTKKRIEQLLELVELKDAKRLTLRHYSKGMLERIGLAASLINDPEILILDEPTTGLDPIGCRDTRNLLLKLKQQGKTILLSSHFLSEVERVCDRIAIFHRGYLLATGTLDGLNRQYQAENLEDLFVKTICTFDNQASVKTGETT
ncbi:MAG TPA: ABC transporter ATP-binding protein [bacterium]|nr:ABC transporter ATP-binding protein [bacterium]HOL34384.1 ABC transporter ATP-binding protein [bacterium]HPP07949.1 ABC transporter ATP-binding protein [bacterium]